MSWYYLYFVDLR